MKNLKISVSSFLLSSLSCISVQNVKAESNLGLSQSQFISPWEGYANSTMQLSFSSAKASRKFEYDFNLRLSNDKNLPLLGNISEMMYKPFGKDSSWQFGRKAPRITELSFLSRSAEFQQRICFNAFDCVEGGAIGVHFREPRFEVSLITLNLPNLSPSPSIDERGVLSSNNRWSSTPIEQVFTNGKYYPLRVETNIQDPLKMLIRPGLDVGVGILRTKNQVVYARYQVAMAKGPSIKENAGLGFESLPDGTAQAVVVNSMSAYFEYAHTAQIKSLHRLKHFEIFSENSFYEKFSGQGQSSSHVVGINFNEKVWSFRSLVAAYQAKGEWHPLIETSGAMKLESVRLSVKWVEMLLAKSKATYLEPELTLLPLKNAEVFVRARLIKANSSTPFFGAVRGNDLVEGGVAYAF